MHRRPTPPTAGAGPGRAGEISVETMHRIAQAIASDLELERIVQTVTDAATELTGAQFGAFFYNAVGADGATYELYTLAGAARDGFEALGKPRRTPLFAPTFQAATVIRCDDVRRDPRHGRAGGMPAGHLPVVSYLAVPVVSRSGEIHGGLLFGHERPGVFTAASERVALMVAAHAALAIDNARLLEQARRESDERRRARETEAWLAAIVSSSEDAIIGQDLDGRVTSWNRGAEKLFGFSAAEAIGRSCRRIVPDDRLAEEAEILASVRAGRAVQMAEAVRRHQDGRLIDVSLSASPVHGPDGTVIGASKIVRDITERRRAVERQRLLFDEMRHRVKNLFALASSLVSLGARSAATPQDLAAAVGGRLGALARAHDLTVASDAAQGAGIRDLLAIVLAPYETGGAGEAARCTVRGGDVAVEGAMLTSLSLLLYEFATNAAKHGCLSTPEGRLAVDVDVAGGRLGIVWRERGGPPRPGTARDGFGSKLEQAAVRQLRDGRIERLWHDDGLTIRVTFSLPPEA